MIVEKNFLSKLKQLGLNSYETKIWTALLSRGISSASELSDISNVPRSRSYDVLENLEKKGFIIMKIGKPIKYIALPPEDVLERVKKRIQVEAEKDAESIEQLKDSEILKELTLLHNKGVDVVDPVDLSGNLKSRTHLYNQLNLMFKNAERSITIMTTTDGFIRKTDYFKTTFDKAKKRGVKIRIATPIASKEAEESLKLIEKVAEVRSIDTINGRFVVVDGKEVTVMLMDGKTDPAYDMGIWVNSPFFANSMENMFDTLWLKAKIKVKA